MFGGMSPKKMQAMMKQMGMAQEEIDASEVIIKKTDGSNIIITNPNIAKINFQGQASFQISGNESEETPEVEISDQDIKTITEKTECTEEQAHKALEETGDLTEAILKLS